MITYNIVSVGITNILTLEGTYGVFHFGYANRDSPYLLFTLTLLKF